MWFRKVCYVSDRERKDLKISWYRLADGKIIKSQQEGES